MEKTLHRDDSKISDLSTERIKTATQGDEELQAIINAINTGWQEKNDRLAPYWDIRDELIQENGVIYKGQAVVIPECLRTEFIKKMFIIKI